MDDEERQILELKGKLADLQVRRSIKEQEKSDLERQLNTGKLAEFHHPIEGEPVRNQPEVEISLEGIARPVFVYESECKEVSSNKSEWKTICESGYDSLESVAKPVKFEIESSESPESEHQKIIEFSPTLRRYTDKTIGLSEEKLTISHLPFNIETYFFGNIRLVSVQADYLKYIPELFHKNIVAQYGLLVTQNKGYFLMLERTVGTSIKKHLKESNLSEEKSLNWLLDVSRALHYFHSLNFYYGELSFDRILIHGSGVKLEHPAVREIYGQGVEQDLLELCKLVQTLSDEKLKRLVEKIESGTIQSAVEVVQYLEELVPKTTFRKGSKSLKRTAPSVENVTVKTAKRPRNVMTFDPDLQIVPENVEDIDGEKETQIGKLVEMETVDGQGHYVSQMIRLDGYYGPALVKYLGGMSELRQQARDYSLFGITNPAIAQAVELANSTKNSEREISFAGKLSHPNIVKILAFVSPDKTARNINGIIMEGAPQGTLNTYAAQNHISNLQYKSLSLQLASAIEYCHNVQGIIHRDIRPENIYVYDDGTTLKIGNFGYARINDEGQPMTATKPENIFYAAPEMISSDNLAVYGFSADVYSFGLTVWSMCHNGSKPFSEDSKLTRSLKKFRAYLEADHRPTIRAELPKEMTVLIASCWKTDSELRPTFSDIVRQLQHS